MSITAINPATGAELETFIETTVGDVREIVHAADSAFRAWRRASYEARSAGSWPSRWQFHR